MSSRYRKDSFINYGASLASNRAAIAIRGAIDSGRLRTRIQVCGEGRRLDHIAFDAYGDGSMWWVIAAASGIGWGLQVPSGTRLVVPYPLSDIQQVV